MKITGLELYPITIRYRRTIGEAFGTVGKKEDDVILKIFTDEGIIGVGEAMTLGPYYSGESQGTVMSIISEHLAPQVLINEDPFNIDKIVHRMDEVVYGHSIAKTAIDLALHDIMGKKLGIPVYRLIGGKYTDRIPLRWAVGINTPEEMGKEALLGVNAGYRCIKMKVGTNPEDDIERVRGLREAVGTEIGITVDANQAYPVGVAIRTIRKMERYNILSVEQPVLRQNIEGLAEVKRSVDTPIGACESAVTIWEVMDIIKRNAADFLNFKVTRSGGFYRSKQIVHMAEAGGIVCVGSTQLGMGIELSATAHFAVSNKVIGPPPYTCAGYGSGLLKLFNTIDSEGIKEDIVENTPKIANGFLYVPESPGLGVELVEDRLKQYMTEGKKPIAVGNID